MFNNRKQRNCYLACFLAVRSVKNIKIEKKKKVKNGVLSFVCFIVFGLSAYPAQHLLH